MHYIGLLQPNQFMLVSLAIFIMTVRKRNYTFHF